MPLQSEYYIKRDDDDVLEMQIKRNCLIVRVFKVIISYSIIFLILSILPIKNMLVVWIIFSLILFYMLHYLSLNTHIFLSVNRRRGIMISYNLWNFILKKPKILKIANISNFLIKECPNPKYNNNYSIHELLEPFERSYDKIIVQRRNEKDIVVCLSNSSENVNYISYKFSNYIQCPVFTEGNSI